MAGVRTTATVDNSHIREIPHRVAMQEARRIAQTPFGKAFSHFLAAFNAVVVSCSVDTVSACNIAWAKLNPLIPDNRDEQLSSIRGALYRLVQEPLHVKIEASFTAGHHFQDSVREIFEANFKTIFQCELHDHAQTLINANNRYAKQVQRTKTQNIQHALPYFCQQQNMILL